VSVEGVQNHGGGQGAVQEVEGGALEHCSVEGVRKVWRGVRLQSEMQVVCLSSHCCYVMCGMFREDEMDVFIDNAV
jgi:hypothetical protein